VTRHIAILIDAGFFPKRLPKLVPADQCGTPETIASQIKRLCFRHVTNSWDWHFINMREGISHILSARRYMV